MRVQRLTHFAVAAWTMLTFSACDLISGDLVPDIGDLVGIQIGTVQPNPAAPGDVVTILGYGFGEPFDASNNSIFEGYGLRISDQVLDFNTGSKSEVKAWNNTEIQFVVPQLDPGTYTITIQVDFEEEYFREFIIAESGSTNKPLAGWILHDETPTATLFYAVASGQKGQPFSWDMTSRFFQEDPTTAEEPYAILFDFPAPSRQGGLELKDVDTDILTGTSFISFSEYPVSGNTANHGIYMFDTNFVTPVTNKILRAGANPFRFADQGPPTLLASDGTVSMLDSENLQISAVFTLASLIDPAFEARNLSWITDPRLGEEDENGRALVLFGTHTGFDTAQIHLIYSTENGLSLDSYSLDGYAQATNVLIAPVTSSYAYVVAETSSGGQEIIKHKIRNATDATEFATPSSNEIQSNVIVPDSIEILAGDYASNKLFFAYNDEEETGGVFSLRVSDAFTGPDLSLDAFFGVTVPVAVLPATSAAEGTDSAAGTDPREVIIDYNSRENEAIVLSDTLLVNVSVNHAQNVTFGTSVTLSVTQLSQSAYGHAFEITSATTGVGLSSTNSTACPWVISDCVTPGAPGYNPQSINLSTSAGRSIYDIQEASTHQFTLSFDTAGEHVLYLNFFDDYAYAQHTISINVVATPSEEPETVDNGLPDFIDQRLIPEQITVAMHVRDGDENTIAATPGDLYVIPGTPLVLVTDNAGNRVSVINAAPEFPLYLHSFPSYASGPTRISCGFNGSADLGDYR